MAKVYCPKCGSEVVLPEKSSTVIGRTISEQTPGSYALPLKQKEEQINNKEKKNMNNGGNFDINELARLVAEQLMSNTKKEDSCAHNAAIYNNTNLEKDLESIENDVNDLDCVKNTDRNHWAENSKFYGKEICGYSYNPYMIRRFLPAQFEQLMKKYDYNVHKGITVEYPYMYSIKYTLEEVRKLAILEKRDKIAFDERRLIFTINKCSNIFVQYIEAVINHLWEDAQKFVDTHNVGKEYRTGIKGYGWVGCGKVVETIVKHRVVKTLEASDKFKEILKYLKDLKEKIENRYHLSYADLYKWMSERPLINVPAETKKSKDFMDCFIKAGAYYTLKQKLMFDGKVIFKGKKGRHAVMLLRTYLQRSEGYQIYAMLKEVNR